MARLAGLNWNSYKLLRALQVFSKTFIPLIPIALWLPFNNAGSVIAFGGGPDGVYKAGVRELSDRLKHHYSDHYRVL